MWPPTAGAGEAGWLRQEAARVGSWSWGRPPSLAPSLYRWEDRGPLRQAACARWNSKSRRGRGKPPASRIAFLFSGLCLLCLRAGPLPLGTARADATPVQTTRPCPSALLATFPDLVLDPEEGCLPGHVGVARAPTEGDWPGQDWEGSPSHPWPHWQGLLSCGPVAGAKIRP